MTFVWTFHGVMEAIGLVLLLLVLAAAYIPIWLEERAKRKGGKK